MKREEFVLEEDSPPPSSPRMVRPKNIEIIEESDSSQVSEATECNFNIEIDSSPVKFNVRRKREEYVLEEDSPPSTPRIFRPKTIDIIEESDSSQVSEAMDSNIKVEIDSSPVKFDVRRKRDEFVLEEDSPPSTLRMFRPKDIEIVEESDYSQVSEEMECDINSSPIKFKARKRDVVEEDLSTPRIFSAKDTNEDDEEEEESEQNDEYSENDESMITINPDDPEFWYFDSEDSDSHDEEVDSKNDEESSDSVEDETVGDPELDFIKPDVLGAPKPAMITANVISTYASDGLIYTELDNQIIIVTPAKHRVKEKGTLSYEDGTGVAFFGPSTGKNIPPRKFIACPLMTKENLF